MKWIKTENRLPENCVEVFCCLRDAANVMPDSFFVGWIDAGKWYIYCSDGVSTPEDNRYYISHWCKIVSPDAHEIDPAQQDILHNYRWIKVKKYKDDETLSYEERFNLLHAHHIETTFLIDKIRSFVKLEINEE